MPHSFINDIFDFYVCNIFQRNILMEKQFVKAKPLIPPKDRGGTSKQYQSKKNPKRYEEKEKTQQKDPREGIKLMIEAYEANKPIPKTRLALDLIANHPRLFVDEQKRPGKMSNTNLNDCLRLGPKREVFIKQSKPLSSDSSEPDWDSDCDKEIKLESKKIDEDIVKKVEEKLKKQPTKKIDELQRYEKQFLEDYYKNKKAEAETNQNSVPNQQESQPLKNNSEQVAQKTVATVWNEYNPQVDALISGGFLQKINNQDNDDDDDFEVDDDWNEEADQQELKKQSSDESSEEMDGDDIFADDKPRTVTERKDSNTEKAREQTKGMVFINDHIFSTIAQKIGIHSGACIWVISNKTDRFRVNTQYMNAFYRQKDLYKSFPYVSLNHSEFVMSDEIETEKGLDKFRRFNERRKHRNNNNTVNRQYQNNRGRKQPHLYKPKN